ncbi:MAG: hypothetical protein HGB32_10780 [Geobacteraceae bacterium]|nr:hypothetical protein [Geobacteraceae bacterium]NTW80620.1 hypothetical protein [Geobacteraceae bacterium]
MIDEYTGKKIVSPLDFISPEKAIINMILTQGKTVKESADFLRGIIHIIEAPAYKPVSDALNQPLAAVIDSIEI